MAPEFDITDEDRRWMHRALELAQAAGERGEVPIGAIVVRNGEIVGTGANCVEAATDGMGHAEILALRQAQATVGDWRLVECTLYVTKEPCAMCAGAAVNCRLGRLVFGCPDPRMGAAGGALDVTGFPGMLHRVPVLPGVLADECRELLQEFFRRRRKQSE